MYVSEQQRLLQEGLAPLPPLRDSEVPSSLVDEIRVRHPDWGVMEEWEEQVLLYRHGMDMYRNEQQWRLREGVDPLPPLRDSALPLSLVNEIRARHPDWGLIEQQRGEIKVANKWGLIERQHGVSRASSSSLTRASSSDDDFGALILR